MTTAGWTCPTCRRQFARAKQQHSCHPPRTVASHFAGKDRALRQLFDSLVNRLEKNGSLRVDAVKTSIHLISRHAFGGVTVRRDHLKIGFLADKRIDSTRIVRHDVLGPHRVEHHVVVSDEKDVDSELLRWLSDAQQMQS